MRCRGVLAAVVLLLLPLVVVVQAYDAQVLKNINRLHTLQRRKVVSKLTDLITMYRTYFEDNLDQCPECSIAWPKTGSDSESINKVDNDIYNVMLFANLSGYPLGQQDFEFLKQLHKHIEFMVPVSEPELKSEAMKLIQLVYKDTKRDIKDADRIYKGMHAFDRTNEYRKNLVNWIIAGLNADDYGEIREDLLEIGVEVMHLFLRRREFKSEQTCDEFLKHLDFLVEQSTIWIWQARGLIFSQVRQPKERQTILMNGLSMTLIEIAWYLMDESGLPAIITGSCNVFRPGAGSSRRP